MILNKDVLILAPDLLQSQDILSKLKKRGIVFSRVIQSNSLEVVAQLVRQGVGCGILPERVLKTHDYANCEKVLNSPLFKDEIYLTFKSEFRKSQRGKVFIQSVEDGLNFSE